MMFLFSQAKWFSFYGFILFQLFSATLIAQDLQKLPDGRVTITSVNTENNKPKKDKFYLQLRRTNDSIEILGTNLSTLPRKLKKITANLLEEKVSRKQIIESASASMDKNYTAVLDSINGFKTIRPSPLQFSKRKAAFLKGKKNRNTFSNQWIKLASFPNSKSSTIKSFQTRGSFNKTLQSFNTDELPGAVAWTFPAIDPWHCVPVERQLFQLLKSKGYGLDKIVNYPYRHQSQEGVRKSFAIYFKKDETIPNKNDLSLVTQYLEQNQFVIINATLVGGASVEGSKERNRYLQTERAKVLSKALELFNENPIQKDTVILSDIWPPFRTQLKKTKYARLDSLSNDSIRSILNTNDSITKGLESILQTQRKAELKLTMLKKLSKDEIQETLRSDLARWSYKLFKDGIVDGQTEKRLYGLIEFLFQQYMHGDIAKAEMERTIDESPVHEHLWILLGYNILKQYELKQKYPRMDSLSWQARWTKFDFGYWLMKAKSNLLSSLHSGSDRQQLIYRQMLADFQGYHYLFIDKELLDINTLCELPLPRLNELMGFRLNQYAFLNEMENNKGIRAACSFSNNSRGGKKMVEKNLEEMLNEIEHEQGLKGTMIQVNDHFFKMLSFQPENLDPYYNLLKECFVKNNNSILKWTTGFQIDAFNLFDLVSANIYNWNPIENNFYDRDIKLEQMHKLIARLKATSGMICPPQKNHLFLMYHLKSLYYLQLYATPGNARQAQIAASSLNYLFKYFFDRSGSINSKLSLLVIKQFNLFNWFNGTQSGAEMGYKLLNKIAATRMLNVEEKKLFAHYKILFDPEWRDELPHLLNREELVSLGEEHY
jgi:hypothetical protein